MPDLPEDQTQHTPIEDKAEVETLLAACIEAIERGENDPAPRICTARPDMLMRVQRRLGQLASCGLIAESDAPTAATLGPYRIVRTLASGGMGTVYLAEQTTPVRRMVAVKVIKLGMDTSEVVARFQAERQALALMSHPHIAQVFDAGITAEGRPFFAMEYVEGENLVTFCDQHRLSTEARIQLLATICRAVQHAHDRGFIHRDLKPSNVLVADHGGQFAPKVIDFGIAKAIANVASADRALQTRADQVLGTPAYMSPEHARSGGLDVDTRSDVYSLGVVMYELLCGQLPLEPQRLSGVTFAELERLLSDELPTLPSRRLLLVGDDALAARGSTRSALQRRIAGELDWITLKALAKSREHRYPSALAFAEDLERWLAQLPVLAAPPARTYRLRKFARRHRALVASFAAIALTIAVGIAVSLRASWLTQRAQQQELLALNDMRAFYGMAKDAVGQLVDVAHAGLADVPMADAVRRRMLADAIGFYEGLRDRQPRDLELRIDLADAQHRIGVLQHRLGQPTDAVETLQQTIADVQQLLTEAPAEHRLLALRVESQNLYSAALLAIGQTEAAKAAMRSALQALSGARGAFDGTVRNADVVEATLLGNLAWQSDEDADASIELFEQALAAFDRAPRLAASDFAVRLTTAARYAEALTRRNRLDDAARVLDQNTALLRESSEDGSKSLREIRAQLASQTAKVLRRLDRLTEAGDAAHRAAEVYHALSADHPDVMSFADGEAAMLHLLAELQMSAAEPALAVASLQRSTAIREALSASHPQDHRQRARTVRSLMLQVNAEFDVWQKHGGSRLAPEQTLKRAVLFADLLLAEHGDDIESLLVYAAAHAAVGAVLTRDQQFPAALAEHHATRDALTGRLTLHENNVELHYLLASNAANTLKILYQMDRFDEAAATGEAGLVHIERGLQLDARHPPSLALLPDLCSLIATARFRAGDVDGSFQMLLDICDRDDCGPNAREQACMTLLSVAPIEHADRNRRLQLTVVQLRKALAQRGTLAEALQRPTQLDGYSDFASRLRDFDLRLALAELLQQLGEASEQDQVLAEAEQLAASLPGLTGNRARNLCDQRAVLLLAADEPQRAADCIEQLLSRVGDAGGANYMAAVLFTRCCAATSDPEAGERLAARAVACLGLALQHAEVPPEAVRHPNFKPLRHREDYQALLEK